MVKTDNVQSKAQEIHSMIANRMMIGSVLMGKRLKKATMKGVDTMECRWSARAEDALTEQ